MRKEKKMLSSAEKENVGNMWILQGFIVNWIVQENGVASLTLTSPKTRDSGLS